ncbi:MAG: hypothetical protein KFW09_04585 [Oscillospiraceae bacterium]|nr:hypothetical protein [Oscillospiraceae bacterium]
MRKENSKFVTGFVSEAGAQLKNRDYFAFVELDNFACYVIADGIDDDQDLESAKIAVTSVIRSFSEYPSMRKNIIKGYLNLANRELIGESMDVKLKSSITLVVTNYVKMVYAVAGNTRFNLFGDGILKQASLDQSLSQDMNLYGNLPLDKIAQHEERHNLYSYLGQTEGFSPFISKKISLSDGDILALFTKGVWENIDTGEMINSVGSGAEPQDVLDSVEETILSRQTLDLTDYTLAIIFIDKIFSDPNAEKKKKLIRTVVIIALILSIVITIVVFVFLAIRNKNKEKLEDYIQNSTNYVDSNNIPRAIEEYDKAIEQAQKLGSKSLKDELNIKKTILESIVQADEKIVSKDFSEAELLLVKAREISRENDNIASDYINNKLQIVKGFIKVHDALSLGDELLELGELLKAEAKFLEARKEAANIFYIEGREQAMQNLEQVYQQQTLLKEEIDSKVEMESAAIEFIKKGDTSFIDNDYDSAEMFYRMAKDKFDSADVKDKSSSIQEKIDLSLKKIADVNAKIDQASAYIQDGDQFVIMQDVPNARNSYILARNIYTELNYQKGLKDIQDKLDMLGS